MQTRNQKSLTFVLLLALTIQALGLVEAGKKKGGNEDIILYRGNIVMKGDKSGGSIVLADQHGHSKDHHEESPDFLSSFLFPYYQ